MNFQGWVKPPYYSGLASSGYTFVIGTYSSWYVDSRLSNQWYPESFNIMQLSSLNLVYTNSVQPFKFSLFLSSPLISALPYWEKKIKQNGNKHIYFLVSYCLLTFLFILIKFLFRSLQDQNICTKWLEFTIKMHTLTFKHVQDSFF